MPAKKSETLTLACFYASLGWSVVPVRPQEKLPAVPWAQYQRQAADTAQLEEWFAVGGFGIGLVQGSDTGTIVLDFDGEEGLATRARLEAAHGSLPGTVEALTPGGGCHVILRHPGRYTPTRKGILPGFDVRGDGGFIVAHPSIHHTGLRYEWDIDHHPDDTQVAFCPAWVADLVCDENLAPEAGTAIVSAVRPGMLSMPENLISDGRETYMRNTVLAVLGDLKSELGRLPTAEQLCEAAWQQYSRKVDFTRSGRGRDELMAKCRYTLARVEAGVLHVQAKSKDRIDPPHDPVTGELIEPAVPLTQAPSLLLSISELEALPPPLWLVDGLVPERSLVMPYGPPKQGKTFVILSMALHIAASMDWMGKAVQGGGVIYIAGEGLGGLGLRVKAMREHYQISADIPFWIARRAVNFGNADAVGHLLQIVRETTQGQPIVLVVVDTLARAAPGVEENSSKEMGVVVAACDRVRDELSCTVMPIHHTGKDDTKGLRGSSAIHGAVDASFKISSSGGRTKLEPMDQKDADPGPPMVFEMKEIMVGIGRNSLVPVLADGDFDATGQGATRHFSANEELAMRALEVALSRFGEIVTGSANVPGSVAACKDETWREAFRSLKADTDWATARKAFQRATSSLIQKRIVGCYAPYVWKI